MNLIWWFGKSEIHKIKLLFPLAKPPIKFLTKITFVGETVHVIHIVIEYVTFSVKTLHISVFYTVLHK